MFKLAKLAKRIRKESNPIEAEVGVTAGVVGVTAGVAGVKVAAKNEERMEAEVKTAPEAGPPDHETLKNWIIDAIKEIYDPEIPVNIYDLGLIYAIEIDNEFFVTVKMTLTAPACPVAEIMPAQVKDVVRSVKGVSDACVNLVWDPPWSKDRISEEALLQMGLL